MTVRPRHLLSFVMAAGLLVMGGCAARRVAPGAAAKPSTSRGYIDLRAGWRVRVVTPVTRAEGGYVADLESFDEQGGSSASGAKNLSGLEVAYYSVRGRGNRGVSVRFESAEIHDRERGARKESRSVEPLFNFPPKMHYVRLVFLTSVSSHDHNQGILAAMSAARLDTLTGSVEENPEANCRVYPDAVCSWVFVEAAAQLQKKVGKEWVSVW